MNLNLLRTFLAVVSEGNFSRAASRLHISQPAVSMQMQTLATELGVELFRRQGQILELTEGGLVLHDRAVQVLALWQDALHSLAGLSQRLRGRLNLGASTIPADYFLPRQLTEFYRLQPGCQLRMTVGPSREIVRALAAKRLDLAVVGYRPEDEDLKSQVLYRDELVAVVSPKHELALAEAYDPARLPASPLLLRLEGSATRQLFKQALGDAGIGLQQLPVAMELGSNGALLAAAALGLGVAIVSRLAAADRIRQGLLVAKPVAGLDLHRNLWLVYGDGPLSPLHKAFIEFLQRSDQFA